METSLLMNRDMVGARISECFKVTVRMDNHQMSVQWKPCTLPNSFDDGWADSDVWDKATIHDIDMNPVRSRGLSIANLLTEAGKICCEN